ncbi:MAG: hypothetical protein CMJ62_11925, partial [Planctomycetaceae bacterium]|nr:hypothetical protein [Planctomycetaceae bacterium]
CRTRIWRGRGLSSIRRPSWRTWNSWRDIDRSARMERMDDFQRAAMDLLASGQARRAFDLSLEPESTRSMYGSHRWGQMALLVFVRRLVWPVTKP